MVIVMELWCEKCQKIQKHRFNGIGMLICTSCGCYCDSNKSNPIQHFREECLADRGYQFLRKDGVDTIWKFKGRVKTHTVCVKPNGDTEDVLTN